MKNAENRNAVVETILAEMAAKRLPTAVEITERIKRKYWI